MKRDLKKKGRTGRGGPVERSLPFSPSPKIVDKKGEEVLEPVRRYLTVLLRERTRILNRLMNPELTLYEAAILLRVSRNTLRRLTNEGALPCTRTEGKQRRFKLNDILAYLARNDPALQRAVQTIRELSQITAQALKDINEDIPPEP
jgi:excisionase family DNA binding protein